MAAEEFVVTDLDLELAADFRSTPPFSPSVSLFCNHPFLS